MSTSFLYHGFSLVGYDYVRTRYAGGAVIFSIKRKRGKFRCSFCRSRDIIFRGTLSWRFRTVPLVYPLARGSGPLFVLMLAVVLLGEEIALLGGIGILFIIGGIYCVHLRSFTGAAFIVLSAYFGIVYLGEKHGRQKLLGAVLINLGVIAIGLSR